LSVLDNPSWTLHIRRARPSRCLQPCRFECDGFRPNMPRKSMNDMAKGMRLCGLALVCGIAPAASLRAQDPRDAMVARASSEFDAARRLQLLMSALNPTAGPPRGAWPVGVQLLAQTLIEDGQDSVAGVWLRWAVRLSPDLQPDTVQFLPRVVSAYRSARDFVMNSRSPSDSLATTTWLWPAKQAGDRWGRLQIASSSLAAPMQVDVKGVGPVAAGGAIPLGAGTYSISASASGYDSARVTREVLPGVTTVIEFHLRSTAPQVVVKPPPATRSPAQTPVAPPPARKGGIPLWAKIGAGGGVVWAILWNAWIKHAHM